MIVNGSDERNKALSFADVTSSMVSMNVPHVYITSITHIHHCDGHSQDNTAADAHFSQGERKIAAAVSGELQQTGAVRVRWVGWQTCHQEVDHRFNLTPTLGFSHVTTLCKFFTSCASVTKRPVRSKAGKVTAVATRYSTHVYRMSVWMVLASVLAPKVLVTTRLSLPSLLAAETHSADW